VQALNEPDLRQALERPADFGPLLDSGSILWASSSTVGLTAEHHEQHLVGELALLGQRAVGGLAKAVLVIGSTECCPAKWHTGPYTDTDKKSL
jgi:hypothetical protein